MAGQPLMRYWTVEEISLLMHLDPGKIWNAIEAGELRGERRKYTRPVATGHRQVIRWLITEESLIAWREKRLARTARELRRERRGAKKSGGGGESREAGNHGAGP